MPDGRRACRRPTCSGARSTRRSCSCPRGRTRSHRKAAERFDLRGVRLWMSVCLVFALAFNVVRFLEFGRSTSAGTRMPTARSSGCCSGCTPCTCSPTSSTRRCSPALMFFGHGRRAALRRRQRERVLLVLRRGVLAADLCRHLPCATDRLAGARVWLALWAGLLAGAARVGRAAADQLRAVVRGVRAASTPGCCTSRPGVALALIAIGAGSSAWCAAPPLRDRTTTSTDPRDRRRRARASWRSAAWSLCAWFALVILATEIPVLVLAPMHTLTGAFVTASPRRRSATGS